MKIISISLLFVASGLSFQSSTWAQMSSGFPTLCQTGEFAFLNARLEKFEKQGKGYNLKQTGKIISLCADKPKEPFSKFFFDLEQSATWKWNRWLQAMPGLAYITVLPLQKQAKIYFRSPMGILIIMWPRQQEWGAVFQ